MDVVALDPVTYRPTKNVKKFDSLVWTERYRDNGDFELTVLNDLSVRDVLPIDSLVSHNNTRAIMIVENHEITRNKTDLKIKISGRSFETFFENRMALMSPLFADPSGIEYLYVISEPTYAAIAAELIKNIVIDGIVFSNDIIPNISVSSVVDAEPVPTPYLVPRGDLYGRVLELLDIGGYGILAYRPSPTILSETDIEIVIHDGTNRTSSVVFSAHNHDFVDAQYLVSSNKKKNAGLAMAKKHSWEHRKPGYETATGFARRAKYTEVTEDVDPADIGDLIYLVGRAEMSIANDNQISLLSCKIRDTSEFVFKTHYDVGDKVSVIGEFGFGGPMRVTEHILTSDEEGTRGYPSLSAI